MAKLWQKNMVLLDANILLELLLPNRGRAQEVANFLLKLEQPTCINALTIHLIFHFGRIVGLDEELLHAAVARHVLLPLNPGDYLWAKENEVGKDFEDALQVATAVRAGCDQFITLDRQLAKNYKNIIPCVVL